MRWEYTEIRSIKNIPAAEQLQIHIMQKKHRRYFKDMTLKEAVRRNPYKKEKGSIGAYIRYLRYNVDGWYSRKSEDIRRKKEVTE